jgi:hypothetical protein
MTRGLCCWCYGLIYFGLLQFGSLAKTGSGAVSEDAAAAFFASTNLVTFHVELKPAAYEQLLRQPRTYVAGRVRVNDRLFEQVGVRLKGSGTFQQISKDPSLALKFNWKQRDQEFVGLTKLFLNNSGQDATFLCEQIASGAFRDADVAVPRITQARLILNDRDLGIHVLAEPVNKVFLKEHFHSAHGNLYEGEFRDINNPLEQDNGPRGNQSDVQRLLAAATLESAAQRRTALAAVLDMDKFLDFLAVEMIVANWDGYAFHQNNFRIYDVPATGRFVVIPHGLDNTFFESGLSLMPPRSAILVSALLDTAQERKEFQERVARLLPRVLDLDRIALRIDEGLARIRQATSLTDLASMEQRVALFRQRVQERAAHLRAELSGARPQSPEFDAQGVARLEGWTPKPDWNRSILSRTNRKGDSALMIEAANGFCFGSWRQPVWLAAGTYRIEASARTRDVFGLPSRTGSGAGVRVLGNSRGSGLQATADWTLVSHQFEVQPGCEWCELVAELRAYSGAAEFRPGSLRLVRLGR